MWKLLAMLASNIDDDINKRHINAITPKHLVRVPLCISCYKQAQINMSIQNDVFSRHEVGKCARCKKTTAVKYYYLERYNKKKQRPLSLPVNNDVEYDPINNDEPVVVKRQDVEPYGKLVRDKIPDIIRKNEGKDAKCIVLDDKRFLSAIIKKLDEESIELIDAIKNYVSHENDGNKSAVVEELSDVLEVIYAIAGYFDVDEFELEIQRDKKREERGGFKNRIFLQDINKE